MFHPKVSHQRFSTVLSLLGGAALLWLPSAAMAEQASPHSQHIAAQPVGMSHQTPAWAEKLKGQTVVEDAMEGRPERAAMVEQQHQRIMEHMSHDPQVQQVNTGMYNGMSMMHQYGAGGQD